MNLTAWCSLILTLSACASVPPPKELIDARATYTRSESGPARVLNPAGLHEAKVALDKAEAAYVDDPGSEATTDLAYLALRRAERTDIEAARLAWQQRRDKARSDTSQAQAKAAASAQAELKMTRAQLQSEHSARVAAEDRAKDVLNKLVAANAAGVKEEARGTVITLSGGVLFASNRAELLPGAQSSLGQIAEVLRGQNKRALIEGHTDARGDAGANVTLSKARADAVGAYLTSQGVASDRIATAGLGSSRPVGDNATPEGRATNRRVEIVIQNEHR